MRTQTTRTLLGVLTAIVTALVLSRPVEADPPKPVGARCRHDQNCQSGTCEKALGAKFGVCASSDCVNDPGICHDSNACTTDFCDENDGCFHEAIVCDDENACTTDFCDENDGCFHEAIVCDDENACTVDTCNPDTGCENIEDPNCDG